MEEFFSICPPASQRAKLPSSQTIQGLAAALELLLPSALYHLDSLLAREMPPSSARKAFSLLLGAALVSAQHRKRLPCTCTVILLGRPHSYVVHVLRAQYCVPASATENRASQDASARMAMRFILRLQDTGIVS